MTLNTVANTLPVMEIYGGAILNIETGGSLTIEGGDQEFYIYTDAGNGNTGTEVNLLGGALILADGTAFGFDGGLLTPGGSLVTDTTTMPGYTIYTSDAAAGTTTTAAGTTTTAAATTTTAAATTTTAAAGPVTLFEDDFSNGATRDGWVQRINGASAFTYDGVATIVPGAAQPSSLWHNFPATVLEQGDTLTLSFEVMMSKSSTLANSGIRFGLGYSSSPLVDGANYLTPVDGYHSEAPFLGNDADPRNAWLDGDPDGMQWGNASTVTYATGALDNNDLYTINNSQMRTVQYRISRNGSVLTGETYVNGAWSAPVTYTAIIADFKFNAVGLMAPYSLGETFTYDNVTVVGPASISTSTPGTLIYGK